MNGVKRMKRELIYFLCTGNSARSQMAEGFARKYLDFDEWEVASAGIETHGLNPLASEVMAEVGIDISNQRSSLIDTSLMNYAEIVVTLCDDAKSRCPATPNEVRNEHWGFEDPAAVEGSKEEKLMAFRRVRDQIDYRIRDFIEMKKE